MRRLVFGAAIGAALLGWAVSPAHTQDEVVLYSPSVVHDSRFFALGSSGVAIIDDANAAYWNPAGLAAVDRIGVAVARFPTLPFWPEIDLHGYALSAVVPRAGPGTVAASIRYIPLGDCDGKPWCTHSWFHIDAGGSYGVAIGDHVALGASARLVHLTYDTGQPDPATIETLAMDVGSQLKSDTIRLLGASLEVLVGVGLNNFGPGVEVDEYTVQEYVLPTILRAGGALRLGFGNAHSLTIVGDVNQPLFDLYPVQPDPNGRTKPAPIGLGAEYRPSLPIAVRAGYRTSRSVFFGQKDPRATLGLGLSRWGVRLDISCTAVFFDRFLIWGESFRASAVVGV